MANQKKQSLVNSTRFAKIKPMHPSIMSTFSILALFLITTLAQASYEPITSVSGRTISCGTNIWAVPGVKDSLVERAKLKLKIHEFVNDLVVAFSGERPLAVQVSHNPPYFSITFSPEASEEDWRRFLEHIAFESTKKDIKMKMAFLEYYNQEIEVYTRMLRSATDQEHAALIMGVINELNTAVRDFAIL